MSVALLDKEIKVSHAATWTIHDCWHLDVSDIFPILLPCD